VEGEREVCHERRGAALKLPFVEEEEYVHEEEAGTDSFSAEREVFSTVTDMAAMPTVYHPNGPACCLRRAWLSSLEL